MLSSVFAFFRSRTIMLNVGSMVACAIPAFSDALPILVAFDWTVWVSIPTAAKMVLALNLINILLRYATKGPVGAPKETPDA